LMDHLLLNKWGSNVGLGLHWGRNELGLNWGSNVLGLDWGGGHVRGCAVSGSTERADGLGECGSGERGLGETLR
jgi:hypothetical protein